MSNCETSLPPGFRFHPTDEELILHYLSNKVASTPCPVSIIAEVNIYKFNPWDLPAKAAFGEKEWYFFSPRDRKYPNGDRPNRAAASGYWKATGTDKVIVGREKKKNIGVKKALVFYKGKPPKGLKTNWIMHEYRLAESFNISNKRRSNDRPMRLDDWVLCRIYMKSNSPSTMVAMDRETHEPLIENAFTASFPSITNQPTFHQSLANPVPLTDYSLPTQFLSDEPSESTRLQQDPVFTDANLNNSSYVLPDLPEQESYDANISHPFKKFNGLCTFANISNQLDTLQYRHTPMNPHLEFP